MIARQVVQARHGAVLQIGMPNETLASLSRLSDADLVACLHGLAGRERDAMSDLVAHLAEFDTRDIHLREGYGSLFVYCRDALAFSEHEAYNRIEVARAARRFPVILDLLKEGSVNLTSVRLLAPHLTPENHRGVLASARGKRKSEVEQIVARLAPWPDVPPIIRKLPSLGPARPSQASSGAAPLEPTHAPLASPSGQPTAATVTALAPDRYKFQLTVGGDTLEKLRLAKDMLRHAIPSGDDAALFDRALTALLADLARKKFAATDSPRPSRSTAADSRHVPAEVKRAVWLRDLGCCAFVGTSGRRCGERGFLEFHHLRPYAAGGPATVPNIQLRCRRHNDYESRAYFKRDDLGDGAGSVGEQRIAYVASGLVAAPVENSFRNESEASRRRGEGRPKRRAGRACPSLGGACQRAHIAQRTRARSGAIRKDLQADPSGTRLA